MELRIQKNAERLDVRMPMPVGTRFLFLFLALIPMLAPYELIFRIGWTDYPNPFFLAAVIISAGAMFISAFLVWAAIAGLNIEMIFDRRLGIFRYAARAPVLRRRVREYPLASVRELTVEAHEWSDGAPTYSLRALLAEGDAVCLSACGSRAEVEAAREQVVAFLRMSS